MSTLLSHVHSLSHSHTHTHSPNTFTSQRCKKIVSKPRRRTNTTHSLTHLHTLSFSSSPAKRKNKRNKKTNRQTFTELGFYTEPRPRPLLLSSSFRRLMALKSQVFVNALFHGVMCIIMCLFVELNRCYGMHFAHTSPSTHVVGLHLHKIIENFRIFFKIFFLFFLFVSYFLY